MNGYEFITTVIAILCGAWFLCKIVDAVYLINKAKILQEKERKSQPLTKD